MNIAFFLTPKNKIVYIYENDTIRQGLEKLKRHGYAAVPILNENEEYVGVVSEGDFLNLFIEGKGIKDLEKQRISSMSLKRDIASVKITTNMDELVQTSLNQNFVPVVDDRNKFIGIITRKVIIDYYYTSTAGSFAYRCGVMDCFAEMVKAGIKRIAFAHPFESKKERDLYIPFLDELKEDYGVSYYLDDATLITDLFDRSLNENTYNIVFYRLDEDLQEYLDLKKYKEEHMFEYDKVREEIAYGLGHLLSYSDETIQRYIESNHNKE